MHHAHIRFGGQHAPDCLCRDCRDSCVPMTGERNVNIIPVTAAINVTTQQEQLFLMTVPR